MKKLFPILSLSLFAALTLASPSSNTASVTVGWNYDWANNPSVTNFVVYWGPSSGSYTNQANVGTNQTYVLTGLIRGSTYFFSATAQGGGLESDYSNEANKTIPKKPGSPTLLSVQ